MGTLIALGLSAGTLMPPFVAILQRQKWPSWVRAIVMLLSSIVVGIVTIVAQEGTLDVSFDNWLVTIAAVATAAQTAYEKYWKTSGIAPIIEAKTSPKSEPPPAPTTVVRKGQT